MLGSNEPKHCIYTIDPENKKYIDYLKKHQVLNYDMSDSMFTYLKKIIKKFMEIAELLKVVASDENASSLDIKTVKEIDHTIEYFQVYINLYKNKKENLRPKDMYDALIFLPTYVKNR
ncbi:hypothetical protein COBT_002362 [Conglomerata obtusa]